MAKSADRDSAPKHSISRNRTLFARQIIKKALFSVTGEKRFFIFFENATSRQLSKLD
jgi:hypothetical protein